MGRSLQQSEPGRRRSESRGAVSGGCSPPLVSLVRGWPPPRAPHLWSTITDESASQGRVT